MVVGEGMERLNQHLILSLLDVKIADSSVSDPAARVESLKQFLVALGSLKLGLNHPEHIWGYRFSLAFSGVTHDGVAINLLIKLGPER